MKAFSLAPYLYQATFALMSVFAAGMSAYGQTCNPGYPASIRDYDVREVAMLPRYCIYTQDFRDKVAGGNNPDEIKRWYSVIGEKFHSMHHYCWGLMATNRAVLQTCTKETRLHYLQSSIEDYDYVTRDAPKDFILLPEIFTKKGENLLRLGRAALGIREFERAIELKPDYWPPYANLSDYFKSTGDIQKAREILQKGLSFAPDASALKRRLPELDTAKGARKPPAQQTGEK